MVLSLCMTLKKSDEIILAAGVRKGADCIYYGTLLAPRNRIATIDPLLAHKSRSIRRRLSSGGHYQAAY